MQSNPMSMDFDVQGVTSTAAQIHVKLTNKACAAIVFGYSTSYHARDQMMKNNDNNMKNDTSIVVYDGNTLSTNPAVLDALNLVHGQNITTEVMWSVIQANAALLDRCIEDAVFYGKTLP